MVHNTLPILKAALPATDVHSAPMMLLLLVQDETQSRLLKLYRAPTRLPHSIANDVCGHMWHNALR